MRYEVARQRRLLGLGQGVVVDNAVARHIKLDTQALFGLMRTAGMLPADVTSEEKFRSGVVRRGRKLEPGPKDSEVANRWNAFLPNLAAVRANVGH
ncbi:hypothetical protein V8C86DRAFT_3123199 [Haematococcus lacustris]